MSKHLFLLDTVLIFCLLSLASAEQNTAYVRATYHSYEPQKHNWELNSSAVCAEQFNKSPLSWRKEYGWAAFCGPVGP
ncbi:chitinase/hevein/PR-4/wheatwin2, partial [Trifolium medium]|nr:chitinase/hevein/PR-4/wheatwin2 [Trifolium medium]